MKTAHAFRLPFSSPFPPSGSLPPRFREALEGLCPPLFDARVVSPRQAVRIGFEVQRAALDTWLESCNQAHGLAMEALGWTESTLDNTLNGDPPGRPQAANEGEGAA